MNVIEKGEEKILRKKEEKNTKTMFDSQKVLRKEKKLPRKMIVSCLVSTWKIKKKIKYNSN